MNLYQNPLRPDHAANNAAFLQIVNDFPQLATFQPMAKSAPWHWQAVIDQGGDVQVINFWPHAGKAQREGYKSVIGDRAIRALLAQALIDSVEDWSEAAE